MAARTQTLQQLLGETGFKVIAQERAAYVPPVYKRLPKEEQTTVGIVDVEEVLLDVGTTVFVCLKDNIWFETPDSAVAHKGVVHGRQASKKAAKVTEPEVKVEPESQAQRIAAEALGNSKQMARRKTQSNARPDLDEPSYSDLKKKLDSTLTRIGELDSENKKLTKELKGADIAIVALRGQLEQAGAIDHKDCYEYIGQGRGNEGKEVAVVRKDGYVFRAYPV